MRKELQLENIRSNLIRQEETIIFSLIERAQFGTNKIIYQEGGIRIPDFDGSFMQYLLAETEKVYARVRRYTSPDEHPFTEELPEPLLTPMVYEWPIKQTDININSEIFSVYLDDIIPIICRNMDDSNYGSSAVSDINSLQALSKRIHYGKFVAESKFLSDEEGYKELILKKDRAGIFEKLTNSAVEEKILERVELKSSTYGQEPNAKNPDYKIQPGVIRKIYFDYIIPLTKEVEYLYLMQRLK